MPGRPDRKDWHLDGTRWLAQMGDCTRRKVGALIVGPDKRLWGSGYNGSYPGGPSCLEGACPRGRHYLVPGSETLRKGKPFCACGELWPCPDAVAPGSSYDTGPGACIASHAESNAIADAMQRGGGRLEGCVMYISCEPCEGCVRHVRNATAIEAIVWPEGVIALP
jgi:dCMP deaminase